MLKALLLSVLGIVLFAGGGAGAWYVAQWQHAQELQAAEEEAPSDRLAPLNNIDRVQQENPLPISVGPQGVSPEDFFRMSALMQEQTQALTKREAVLAENESRLKLVTEDMNLQQKELEGLLTQIHDALREARELLSQVHDTEQKVKTDRDNAAATLQQLEKAQRVDDQARQQNQQRAASLLQSMSPVKSAATIRTYCDDGKCDLASELLSLIEERKAAEILNSLDDPGLVAELTERLQSVHRNTTDRR